MVEKRTYMACPRNCTPFMTSALVAWAACENWMSAFEWSAFLGLREEEKDHMIFTRSTSPKQEKMLNNWLGKRFVAWR